MKALKKYADMTEEELNALPVAEQERIKKEIELEAQAMAKDFNEAFEKMSDEEKAKIKEGMIAAQKSAERQANYTEAEIMAEMMNPETEGYTKEELEAAENLLKDPEYYSKHPYQAKASNAIAETAKHGIIYAIKAFFRKLFK